MVNIGIHIAAPITCTFHSTPYYPKIHGTQNGLVIITLFADGSLPWHRVHAVSPEGPVGTNGIVQPGDHLVEVIKTCYKD